MIEDWLQLQKVSLFGTAKESLDKLSFSDTLSGFRENVKRKAKNPEEEFFFLCALSLNYINAGKEFPKMSEIPYKEAEPETKAIISAEKTSILQKILSHDFADVLQFFLSACVNTKEIIPPEFVPRLLDYGKKFIELRKYLPDSTGKRGEWLVSLNPDWDYLSPKTEKEAWEEGKTAERVELLKNVRERDAALSREYLLSTWKEENAANRTAFLLCMRQGLSPDDEKMLESFLSDKSDRVRSIAVDFLVRIKDSKLRSKLSAYIPSCIKFKGSGKLLSSASLEFNIKKKQERCFRIWALNWIRTSKV
ncbi:MAG: hypothetical protein KDK45_03865 [Leptospiraceae bacterium]|nr:hypothetical protein [Leptospiraceae bacterium]